MKREILKKKFDLIPDIELNDLISRINTRKQHNLVNILRTKHMTMKQKTKAAAKIIRPIFLDELITRFDEQLLESMNLALIEFYLQKGEEVKEMRTKKQTTIEDIKVLRETLEKIISEKGLDELAKTKVKDLIQEVYDKTPLEYKRSKNAIYQLIINTGSHTPPKIIKENEHDNEVFKFVMIVEYLKHVGVINNYGARE